MSVPPSLPPCCFPIPGNNTHLLKLGHDVRFLPSWCSLCIITSSWSSLSEYCLPHYAHSHLLAPAPFIPDHQYDSLLTGISTHALTSVSVHSAARETFLPHKPDVIIPTFHCASEEVHATWHGSGDLTLASLSTPTPHYSPLQHQNCNHKGLSQPLGNISPALPQYLCISRTSAWNAYLEATLFRCHFLNQ